MNRHIKLFTMMLVGALAAVSSACNSLLDLEPHSAVSPGSVSSKDIEALRAGMYAKVQELPQSESYIMFDLFGGNLTTKASVNSLDLINSLSSALNGIVEAQWQGYYQALMQVNNVYSIAQSLPEGSQRDRVIGECHYFRAYLHLCLVTRFGDVPLMRENTDDLVSRTPASEVWDFIDEELRLALETLGTPTEGYYYLSADAAKALKARVALYRGNKTEAAELAESLIADARYDLDDFEKIFRGKSNKELIFAFSCLPGDNSKIAVSALFYSYNHPNSGSYVYRPAGEVMTLYEEGDLRREISITTLDNLDFINKYPSGQTGTDPMVISRLGEMYLISAEAQGLEKGLHRLNELRNRRGLENIYPSSEAKFIDALLEERRRELLCENHRWYDLVRLGKAVEVLGIQPYQTLMPIPASEISVNKNLTQNEGY